MSLIKKSDVKNHLSSKASNKVLQFIRKSQPDATGYSGGETRGAKAITPSPSAAPGADASPRMLKPDLPVVNDEESQLRLKASIVR
jgi:hypothetical protein